MKKYETFNIIRGRNTPNKVTLFDGSVAYRKPKIYIPDEGWEGEVPCLDYDNHFIFEVPGNRIGPKYLCSCSSMAIIVGRKQYEFGSSLEGARFVCYWHLTYGVHLDGST